MNESSQIFKALSEEIRLRIILLLLEGEQCACDLMAVLDLPQSTVSRHLSYLKNAGWIQGRREGIWMHYMLSEDLGGLRQQLKALLARCLPEASQGKDDLEIYLKRVQKGCHKKCS